MNTFFALEIPPPIRDEIATQSREWRLQWASEFAYRWVNPVDYHITLLFLGDLNETGQELAIQKAMPIAETTHPFSIQLAPPGVYKRKVPGVDNVLWLGVRKSDDLTYLASDLQIAWGNRNISIEGLLKTVNQTGELYKPHVTLARGPWPLDYFGVNLRYEHPFPQWQADRFVLIETLPLEARRNDPNMRYNIVHAFPFSGASAIVKEKQNG
jgi:2'-5' RNA ligase